MNTQGSGRAFHPFTWAQLPSKFKTSQKSPALTCQKQMPLAGSLSYCYRHKQGQIHMQIHSLFQFDSSALTHKCQCPRVWLTNSFFIGSDKGGVLDSKFLVLSNQMARWRKASLIRQERTGTSGDATGNVLICVYLEHSTKHDNTSEIQQNERCCLSTSFLFTQKCCVCVCVCASDTGWGCRGGF